jgi:hypothetical protein
MNSCAFGVVVNRLIVCDRKSYAQLLLLLLLLLFGGNNELGKTAMPVCTTCHTC